MSPFLGLVSAGGIGKATYTATTGSPSIDTSTRAGKTIIKFTGSGSVTIGTAGTCEVLMVAGGGGGNGGTGGSGAGGYVYDTTALLKSGVLTVTVGAGGAVGAAVDLSAEPAGAVARMEAVSIAPDVKMRA